MPKEKKIVQKENRIHLLITEFLRKIYPDVIFRTDFAAGIKMTIGQAMKHKRLQSSDAYPDLFIAEPRNGYNGLFIELKKNAEAVYKKDKTLREVEHIQKQYKMLQRLQDKGYKAVFGFGYSHTITIINEYLKGDRVVV